MSHDIKGIKIQDPRINDLTNDMTYPIFDGASNNTYQAYPFTGSNSSLTVTTQIPSESILTDARVLLQSDLNLTINLANVPIGTQAFQIGSTDSLAPYPLQSLFTTASLTLNNATSSTNYSDVFPMIKILEDKCHLSHYNSTSPNYINKNWGMFSDAILTNSNPMANFNEVSVASDWKVPNGAFPYSYYVVQHYIAGVLTDDSLISTSTSDTWKVYVSYSKLTEPFLCLSPFINDDYNKSGLIGINTINLVLNIDTACRRVWNTGNSFVNGSGNGLSTYITSISLGNPNSTSGFSNTKILYNFLSLSDLQYSKISTKSVIGFSEYARYLTQSSNAPVFSPNTTNTITLQNIQINQIPSIICVNVAVPQNLKNWGYTDSFFKINNVSITFNNQSGLLASADITQLFELSQKSGSTQSYYAFSGKCLAIQNGQSVLVPSLGSLLVLNPAFALSLPPLLSNSSIAQINLQITINCTNTLPFSVQPEATIMCINSGYAISELGSTSFFTAVLDREMVLQTKASDEHHDIIDQEMYSQEVGGKMYNFGSLSKFHKMTKGGKHHMKKMEEDGGRKHHMSKSKLSKLLK
jgi:hypothetical protein